MSPAVETSADTLSALLASAVARRPHDVALICGTSRVTFAELETLTRAFARGLADLRVNRGDRVAIWLPNVPLWCVAFLACAQIGAIAIGVNTRFRAGELEDVLGRSEAKVLIMAPHLRQIDFVQILENVDPTALEALEAVVVHSEQGAAPDRLGGKRVIDASKLLERPRLDGTAAPSESGCIIFTTSGTTSAPKFVLHDQRSIVVHARDTVRALGYDAPGSTIMAVTPFSGVSGFGLPIAAIAAAAPLVFAPSFDAQASLADIREHRVTHIHANHEIIRRWFDAAQGHHEFATLKLLNCGSRISSVMPAAEALRVPLLSIYGSSELQARYSRQRPDIAPERALEAGGFPISEDGRVRTSDPANGRALPTGEKGELELRGPSGMSCYFGDSAATARAITSDGYIRTGDFGWTREDGSFVLEGRMGDVLKLSGFMTSPAEIEAMLARHPTVAGCQVVGVTTERGERPVAFVRTADGTHFDEAKLLDYCGRTMARYKVPVRIFPIGDFPMTEGSNAPKVRKTELRHIAEARLRT